MKIYVLTNSNNTPRRFKSRRMAVLAWYLEVTSYICCDVYATAASGYLVQLFLDGDMNVITWTYLSEELKKKTIILKEIEVFLG